MCQYSIILSFGVLEMENNGIHENLIKVTEYTLKGKLPNPFIFDDGTPLSKPEDWERRRKEIYKTAIELQYGTQPPKPEFFKVEPIYMAGLGKLNTFRITAGTNEKQLSFTMTVFRTKKPGKFPVVVDGDLCFPYPYTESWVNHFIDNDINFVTFNRTELFPDIARYNLENAQVGSDNALYKAGEKIIAALEKGERQGPLAEIYPEYTFGAIGAWAWGYSRCLDALEILDFTDLNCVTFTGHSRGGKTAMLAGALDERAHIVNPNGACAGGCSCYRLQITAIREDEKVETSEPISNIFHHFPMWMGQELRPYIDNEEKLPFDAHFLKAMVAPRILFVSEGASDIMSNPIGSWQTTMGAKEVYKFLGCEENLLWYFRRGGHGQKDEDLEQLINVIKNFYEAAPLNDKFFKLSFKKPELAFDWKAEDYK